jgi:hypothetical protein
MTTPTIINPSWWDEKKLRKVFYDPGYSGWIIDLGDGTGRYANPPMLGCDDDDNPRLAEINRNQPHWGDRVKLVNGNPDPTQIIERWEPENYDENGNRKIN